VLPDVNDRGVVLLGFSGDGEHMIGYRDDSLLLWHICNPRCIVLTDSVNGSDSIRGTDGVNGGTRPCMRVPFPQLSSIDLEEEEDSQIELEVLQSEDSSLLVMFCSRFTPCETDRGVAVTLVPCFYSNSETNNRSGVNGSTLNSPQTIVFPSIFIGSSADNRYLINLSLKNQLLVLNCGDILRFISIDTDLDRKTHRAEEQEVSEKEEEEEEALEEKTFPSRIQIVKASNLWWGSAPTLEYEVSGSHGQLALKIGTQCSFEIEPFLSNLLAAQLRNMDGMIADYDMMIVDPYFRCPLGRPHILVGVVVKVNRRFSQITYIKRPRDTTTTPACLIGLGLAINPTNGDVAVLKSVHLKPPPSRSSSAASLLESSSKMLKKLTQHFALSLKSMTFPSYQRHSTRKGGRRLSNIAVLRSMPISMLVNPVLPIGIKL
jgi:hypothetical protein